LLKNSSISTAVPVYILSKLSVLFTAYLQWFGITDCEGLPLDYKPSKIWWFLTWRPFLWLLSVLKC